MALVKAGILPVSELGDDIVEQTAKDFLNEGGALLSTFAGTNLLDRIARRVHPEQFAYSGAFVSYFAVCSQTQAELVIVGYADPERLTEALAASPLDGAWLSVLAGQLAERACTRHEWRSVLCALGAFAASPRRDELRYVKELPLGYRRSLELISRTATRLRSTINAPASWLAALAATIETARRDGPRLEWPSSEEPDDCDERVRAALFELERAVQEAGLWGASDEQSRDVELALAHALLFAIEQGDPAGRRAIARQWLEHWLDEDVVAAATAFS